MKFQEKIIDNNPLLREEMVSKSNGKKTVPQIFIGEKHVGGYDDLELLLENDKLMSLVNENKFKVACFQTNSSDIPEENIFMLEKIFSSFKEKNQLILYVFQNVYQFLQILKN